MKKLIIGFIIGFMIGSAWVAFTDAGDRSMEHVLNRVWNSSTNVLNIKGI